MTFSSMCSLFLNALECEGKADHCANQCLAAMESELPALYCDLSVHWLARYLQRSAPSDKH